MKSFIRHFSILLIAIILASCKPVPVSHWFPVTPQEFYEKDLYKAKLEKTTAGQTWFTGSKSVLKDTLFSIAPHQERFYLGDSIPAQSIRLKIPEGRNLVVTPVRSNGDTISRLFLELYRIKTNGRPQRIEYLKKGQNQITYSNHEGDTLLLRMQTGLAEKLLVTLSITTSPSLLFPVTNHGMQDLISAWGAERDGGVRSHEGVDIKAKRGTPVIAAADGFITQTGTNNLGGKIIFLSVTNMPYSIYYAHLDSQIVFTGKRVLRGDTLGLVGNTGNALTTSPHLHFGIYTSGSGAVNPLPFINDRKEKLSGLPEISKWLGDSVKTGKKVNIFSSSDFDKANQVGSVPTNSTIRIIGEMAKGYRIVTPDGTKGYIQEVPLKPLKNENVATSTKEKE